MKTTRMTIKEIVDTIPARLGLNADQLDLSTPQKVYDFLTNQEFQIFAKASGCDHIFDSAPGNSMDLQTSYKSMYDVNNLFSASSEKVEEMQKKYGVTDTWIAEFAVDSEDGTTDWCSYAEEDLHYIEEDKWPYVIGFDSFGKFDNFIETVKTLCKVNSDWAKLRFFISDEKYSMSISEDGVVTNNCKYTIRDDNGSCFAYDLAMFLEVFMCDTFEKIDEYAFEIYVKDLEKVELPLDSGLMYEFLHKDELANEYDISKAVELIKKYPRVLLALPEEVQKNKLVAETFIKANDAYMGEANAKLVNWQYGRHAYLSGSVSRGQVAYSKLNGIVNEHGIRQDNDYIKEQIINYWCHIPELFEQLVASSMFSWIVLDEELMGNIDHKRILEMYPKYIYVLRDYFEAKVQDDEKLTEHIKRRFRLLNDVEYHSIAVMAVYEMIIDFEPTLIAKLIDSYESFVLAPYVEELLRTVPRNMRDDIIKTNIKMAYYIADELESDEKIVDYICEHCPKAGDILSDEIVIKRGIKRSALNISDVCENCDYC